MLCFNRDLKEKLKVASGPGGTVETFYGAVDRALTAIGSPIDHGNGADWDREVDKVFASDLPDDWRFDCIIVDEGQDFTSEWREMLELELFGHSASDRIWLDDPDQAIQFGQESSDAEWPRQGWTGYRATKNYRTPSSIARYIKLLLPFEFQPANAHAGNDVGVTRVSDRAEIPAAVGRITSGLVSQGYSAEDIVVLSLKGLSSATLAQTDRCGGFSLRRPLGTYDLFGNQEWTAGRLRFDTIRRYKGQQDTAVILTDVDRPADAAQIPQWQRLMFAALTRATDRVDIVGAGSTADLLADV